MKEETKKAAGIFIHSRRRDEERCVSSAFNHDEDDDDDVDVARIPTYLMDGWIDR